MASEVGELKTILKTDSVKRIGVVSEINTGSVILTDLLDRKFRASIPNELSIIVGNYVIVSNDVVIGKTESQGNIETFLV